MNYFNGSSISFLDLRPMLRRGQIYSFDTEFSHYGGVSSWRLFATVVNQELEFKKILVGHDFETAQELTKCFMGYITTEPPADYIHYVCGFPAKPICGVGIYSKLCGVDRTKSIDEFLRSQNQCIKCAAILSKQ